eukprot:4358518-Amphidinium_carterae.2
MSGIIEEWDGLTRVRLHDETEDVDGQGLDSSHVACHKRNLLLLRKLELHMFSGRQSELKSGCNSAWHATNMFLFELPGILEEKGWRRFGLYRNILLLWLSCTELHCKTKRIENNRCNAASNATDMFWLQLPGILQEKGWRWMKKMLWKDFESTIAVQDEKPNRTFDKSISWNATDMFRYELAGIIRQKRSIDK